MGNLASARIILDLLFKIYRPKSVILTLAVGIGSWLRACAEQGVGEVVGVDSPDVPREQLLVSLDRFLPRNISEAGSLDGIAPLRKFDLIICSEIAQCLSVDRAPTFVDELCSLGELVLFSAAIPGQGGDQHLHQKVKPAYWGNQFARNDFLCFTDLLRPELWSQPQVEFRYAQNAFCSSRVATPRLQRLCVQWAPPRRGLSPLYTRVQCGRRQQLGPGRVCRFRCLYPSAMKH